MSVASPGSRPRPFSIATPAETLDDLRARLERTRWPRHALDAGWELGTDVGYLRDLVTYWRSGFD